jgi:hypothetical protein
MFPVTGSYAAWKDKPIEQSIVSVLYTAPRHPFKYGGSGVIVADKERAQGLIVETTMGLYPEIHRVDP